MAKAAKSPETREERYTRELRTVCALIGKGKGDKDSLPWLSTLCNLVRGTDSLRWYLAELLKSGVSGVELPEYLSGIYYPNAAREFERKKILIDLPVAMRISAAHGEKKRARRLFRRIQTWEKEFEKQYGQKAANSAKMTELERELKSQLAQLEKPTGGHEQ